MEKDYLSYQSNLKVTQGQNVIYCTSQAGVFSYNKGDNSTEKDITAVFIAYRMLAQPLHDTTLLIMPY